MWEACIQFGVGRYVKNQRRADVVVTRTAVVNDRSKVFDAPASLRQRSGVFRIKEKQDRSSGFDPEQELPSC